MRWAQDCIFFNVFSYQIFYCKYCLVVTCITPEKLLVVKENDSRKMIGILIVKSSKRLKKIRKTERCCLLVKHRYMETKKALAFYIMHVEFNCSHPVLCKKVPEAWVILV